MLSRAGKNIQNFTLWLIPLIVVSKIVRWTIMKPQLVYMSIGWGMTGRIARGEVTPFHASIGEISNAASVAVSNTEALFNAINIFGIDTYVGWEIFITLVFNLFLWSIVNRFYRTHPYAGWKENVFIYLNIAVLNIFCLNMAKEPYQLIFFFLMAYAIRSGKTYRGKCIALMVVLVLTVLFARKYYAMIIMYFIVLQIIVARWFDKVDMNTKRGRKKLYIYIFLMFALFGVFHYFMMSYLSTGNEDMYEELVAANSRDATGAVSEITPMFPGGNPLLLAVDYFVKIFRLMFPVELLVKGKVTYLFMIVYQYLLFLFMVRAFRGRHEKQPSRTIALYLYLAFLLCSAAFEPDFGSWVRHEGVAFPIILLIL